MPGPDGAKPVVRAGFLRKLLLRLDPSWPVQAPGVRIKGARIEGALDLSDCAGGAGLPALALTWCEIPGAINLSHTRLARLSLESSRMRRVIAAETMIDGEFCFNDAAPLNEDGDDTLYIRMRAARIDGDVRGGGVQLNARETDEFPGSALTVLNFQGVRVGGSVLLAEAQAKGCLMFMGAEIAGALDLSNAQLGGPLNEAGREPALAAPEIQARSVVLDGLKAAGEVDFFGAHVRGAFSLKDCALRSETGAALRLINAEIGGDFRASGKISGCVFLTETHIGRELNLRGVEIALPTRGVQHDVAIDASALRVDGPLRLDGANIKGMIMLMDARVDGGAAFGGARFIANGEWAINAANMRIGGDLSFLVDSLTHTPYGSKTLIEGAATFARARIDGAMRWQSLEMRGKGPNGSPPVFSFADAAIAGPIEARGLTTQADAQIDASGASCAALDDDVKTGCGAEGARLSLEGFSYRRIDSAKENWRARLAWLKRTRGEDGRYSPQPFSQAAQAYARAGKRESARRILLAQHDLRAVSGAQGPI
ncbi:MAG TPA: hypothetical protein PLS69_04105, partial [Terricaulis sp.]|nr:hypothetical protein [Terricaulis sp.]